MSSNFFLSTINKTYANNNTENDNAEREELPTQKYSTLVALYTAMSNQTVKTYFKHLNKKDPITKVKALDNILGSLKGQVPVDELTWSLPDWVITYATLSFDDSHEVRNKTQQVHELIIDIVGMNNMESYVSRMIGYWLCGMFDIDANVAKAARSSFKKAFKSSKKQAMIINKHETVILNHLIGNFNTTIKKLGNNRDEAKSRYQRLIASSIHTFKLVVTVNPNMDNPTMNDILGNKLFWKFLTIKKFSVIRAAAYQLISTVCEKAPHLIQPHLNILTPLVLSCFSEKDPLVHQYIVEGLTRYLNAFSDECWQYVAVWKDVFPKLWVFLAEPYHSSPYHTYETLLPFLSMINSDVLKSNAQSCQFVDEFFSNMWNGFIAKQNHRRDLIPIIKAYSECLTFVVVQHAQFLKNPEPQQVELLLTNLFTNYLVKPYQLLLGDKSQPAPAVPIQQYREDYIKSISLPLSRFVRKPNLVSHVKEFLITLVDMIKTSNVEENNVNIHDLLSHVIEDNEGSLLWDSFIKPLFYDWMDMKNYAGASLLAELDDMSYILKADQLNEFYDEYIIQPIKQLHDNKDSDGIDLENLLLIVACMWTTYPESIENQYNDMIKYLGNADYLHTIVNISSFVISTVQPDEQETLKELKECLLLHMHALAKDHSISLAHKTLVEAITLFITDLAENHLLEHDEAFLSSFIIDLTKIITTFNFAPLPKRRSEAQIMLQWLKVLPVLDQLTSFMKEKPYFLDYSWNVYRLAFSEDPMDIGYVSQRFVNTCLTTKVINIDDWVEVFTTPSEKQKFSALTILQQLSEGFFSKVPDDMVIEEHTKILKSTRPSTLEIQHEIINEAMGWNHTHCIKKLVLNRRLWKALKTGFLNSILSFKSDGVILVPNIDIKKHPKHQLRKLERFEFIMRYGRWLQFVCDYLLNISKEERKDIILEGGSILKHSWLLASIAKAYQYAYLFHHTVQQQLHDVMHLLISETLHLYPIDDEKWVSMIKDGLRQFAFKKFVLIEFMNQFITFLDNHKNQHVATKIVKELFSHIWEQYWFNNEFNNMLSNKELLVTNKYLIEGWFSAISPEQLKPLQKFVQNNDTYYDQIVNGMSQSVSLLLFYSKSIKGMQPEKVHALLNYQHAITLLNHYIAPTADDEVEFTVGVLFRYLTDLIHAIIDSNEPSYLVHSEQIICDISNHLYVTAGSASEEELKSKHHLQFLLQFIEQNFSRLTSLEGQSLSDLHSRLSAFSPMLSLFNRVVRYHLSDSSQYIELFKSAYRKLLAVWKQFIEYETKHFDDPVLDHFVMYDIISQVAKQCSTVLCHMHPDNYTMLETDELTYSLCTYLKHTSNHVKVSSAMLLAKSRSIVSIVDNLSQFRSNLDYNKYFSEQQDSAQPYYDEDETSLVTDDILLAPFQVVLNIPPESAIISKFHTKTILSFHEKLTPDSLLSYMCAWFVLFELSRKSNIQDRSYIGRYVKAKNTYQNLLNVLFAFVLHDPEYENERSHEHQLFSRDIPEMDSIRSRRSIDYVMNVDNSNLGIFGCHLIYKMIVTFSGIVRYWMKDQTIVNRSIQPSISNFIGTVLCGSLIRAELDFINERKASLSDDVELVVNTATRRVRVTYTRDDMGLSIVITIPQTYPLERLDIKYDSKSKIAARLSQKWVASMTNSLFSLDGNIMDSIETWIKNLDRHFEGVEPCPICYSILHGSTYSTPRVKCTVCKNKFHASCLVKWFTTSGKNSCPMCRSLNKFKRTT